VLPRAVRFRSLALSPGRHCELEQVPCSQVVELKEFAWCVASSLQVSVSAITARGVVCFARVAQLWRVSTAGFFRRRTAES
jgi:hypothetical protein